MLTSREVVEVHRALREGPQTPTLGYRCADRLGRQRGPKPVRTDMAARKKAYVNQQCMEEARGSPPFATARIVVVWSC